MVTATELLFLKDGYTVNGIKGELDIDAKGKVKLYIYTEEVTRIAAQWDNNADDILFIHKGIDLLREQQYIEVIVNVFNGLISNTGLYEAYDKQVKAYLKANTTTMKISVYGHNLLYYNDILNLYYVNTMLGAFIMIQPADKTGTVEIRPDTVYINYKGFKVVSDFNDINTLELMKSKQTYNIARNININTDLFISEDDIRNLFNRNIKAIQE